MAVPKRPTSSDEEALSEKWEKILADEGLAPVEHKGRTRSINFDWSTHNRWVGEHSLSAALEGSRTQVWCKSLDIGCSDRWLASIVLDELGIGEREAAKLLGVSRTTYRTAVVDMRQACRDVANDVTPTQFEGKSKLAAIKRWLLELSS